MLPSVFGQSPWAVASIFSRVMGGMQSSTAGTIELAMTSSAIGQTVTWPSVGYPISTKVTVHLNGQVIRTVELTGSVPAEIDLTGDF